MNNDYENNHNNVNDTDTPESTAEHKPYTYTYGPNRSASSLRSAYENQLMKMTDEDGEQGNSGWGSKKPGKKKSQAKAMVAAFLVGAVVISGFMYASDRTNLFTGNEQASTAATTTASNSAQQAAGVTTASVSVDATIADVYKAASPAVVKIENYTQPVQSNGRGYGGRGGFQGFGEVPQTQEGSGQSGSTDSSQLELAGTGTGFFFESSGYILTNQHVVADASQVKVQVEGYDEPFIAEVVGEDADQDLAVLKINGTEAFPTLAIGDSNQTAIGDWVIAIGNPYGFDHTMTVGVLSAKERPITISDEDGDHVYEHLLQTDASINPGNSGGPLLNASGQVIGINTAVNSEAQGIGFAIPTSTIQEALKQLVGHNV
ncbi:S1C family serine protease [Paenibacillus sp. YAF4_2]|uniref:S1C family serine protease n=1 Tax=Paenibacillus sp. YAF4_2 TaxID=3233085 RepID=UPI003F9D5854